MARNKEGVETIQIDTDTLGGLDHEKIIKCSRCHVGHDIYSSEYVSTEEHDEDEDCCGYVCEYCLTEEDHEE